ncbi:pectin lyase fold/virulence factor [Hypoxylon sp. FL1150]|nr:pectin lyase fold/virulence factor [Hypoxylon sp. FL1150]
MQNLLVILLLCFCTWSSASQGLVNAPLSHPTCHHRPRTSSSASVSVPTSTTNSPSAITVSPDGSTGYSSIGAAISYAQANGFSVVNILAGTYTENVIISKTAAVTVVGETTSGSTDYSDNLVTISNGGGPSAPLTFNTAAAEGVAWKNINFINTNSSSTAGLVYLRGSKNAFYSCSFTAAGSVGFTGSYASGIIANSYLEAADKVIASYASLYIYGSTITATSKNALMVYNKGATYTLTSSADSASTLYNSTVVLDTCNVIQKTGYSNTNVFLAAANGVGSVVVYRDTTLASFIAASGAYTDSTTKDSRNKYIEFGTSGAGSYPNYASTRATYVSWVTDVVALSAYKISVFFTTVYPTVAVTTIDWIDSAVLSAIQASNAADSGSSSSASIMSSSSSSMSFVSTSTSAVNAASTSSAIASTISSSASIVSTSTISQSSGSLTSSSSIASASATSCLPSSMPSTALIVGPDGSSCAQYTTDSTTTQYIYIMAGTYTEQATLARSGSTIIRGETTNSLTYSSNKVTIKYTAGVSSSAGGSSGTATFSANKYEAKLVSFYNINFENAYPATTNYVAFYGCSITATQGTLGGRIVGTTDFIWGQGAGYIFNSIIVSSSTSTGQNIAAHKYQGSYGGSRFVFDTCAIVPKDSSLPTASTYLGRDYSTNSTVAFVNSYLDNHIASLGWKISSSSSFIGSFVEANNTGPGAGTTGRVASAKILTDSSAYTVANILGDVSWLDSSAIAPFSGWPDSAYASTATSTSSAAVSATATSSATASATSSSSGSTLTVAPTPTSGQYGSVSSAIAALPSDGLEYTIYILAGTYEEQLSITRRGKVTLRGETTFANDFTKNTVLIQFSDGVSTSANQNEETPVINWKNANSDGLALYNINFTNTYPQTSSTAALAADFYGQNMAAYGCAFKGYQDSLLVNQGVQVFSNSYIEGSVDFIWGYSKAFFHQCQIVSNTANAYITAQNRPSSSWAGGFVFDHSVITYSSSYGTTYGSTYLGRPWSQYAIAVYMNSFLDQHIAPVGWSVWQTSDTRTGNVMFGEYKNTGPGNWTSSRASFATQLTDSQAASYSLSTFIGGTDWLDMTAYNLVPSYSLTSTTGGITGGTTGGDTGGSSTVSWTHPTDGTTPPDGAVLVSVDSEVSGSYKSLTDALASLPSDSTLQVIYMYPGTYNEQPPAINRAGQVVIMGYTSDAPGRTYKTNQVTITQARGLSVSPLPTGHSDAETATIQTASKKISMYNINIVNSDNLDGSQSSYVTLAASIYGDKIGFYGCSFTGWQDTLLTGATAGYQYYENSYIEGAIDFIWGYSKAYFKGCTIGAKRAKSAVTAHSRSSLTAIGGYVFDQCLFTAADAATVDLTGLVYLGRPYSQYASVVIKNSYLDDVIQPAGWKVWSTTDPRTDYVTFAEFNNSGPGNWEQNAAAREAFGSCTLLTEDDYPLTSVMDSTDWIDMTYWDSIVTPSPATESSTPTTTTTTYSSTEPPAGAYIVSKTTIEGKTTYDTIQSALDALPTSSKTTATVFIYPGTYEEKLVLSKSGTTIFLGYTTSPGDYSQNQVTITYNQGVDTQSTASNSDSATVYATGNYFQAVNINFANTFGTTKNYASLGFGVKSSKYASLYGCQVYGNQDALLINGYFFASNSYIEGNVDMIWGSGADGIALTADKRTDGTTAAGFVFDQCTIQPAAGASYSSISLGRPWNQYARVAFATGWDYWTSSDPRTSDVLFGELANYGPGASTTGRASFATQLDASSAAQFELSNFFAATSWINTTFVSATPFTGSNVAVPLSSSSTVSTVYTTVYTTTMPIVKETLYTTITGTDKTVSVKTTTLLDVGTTVSEPPVTKTTTIKSTTTNTLSVTEADETFTKKSTATVDVGTTVTPESVTRTVSSTITFTATDIATTTPRASTIKTTTTETSYVTSTPKPTTSTTVVGSTVTSTRTSTPKAVTVTNTQTSTLGSNDITTVSKKATTSHVTVFTTSTTTAKSTTTLSCTSANVVKRDAEFALPTIAVATPSSKLPVRLDARGLVTTNTVTVASTVPLISVVKTSTVTIPGSTVTTEVITTKTTGKTSTLDATTEYQTVYSVATRTTSVVQPGSTVTTTSATTITTGKTSTLQPSTVTTTAVGSTTRTVTSQTTLAPATVTSVATTRRTVTSVLAANTVTVTQTSNVSSTQTVTLPASTVTQTTTVKTTLTPTGTTTLQSTVTRTSTVKVVHTTTSVATRTAKGAGACPTA